MSHGRHSYIAFYPSDWTGGTARMTRIQRSVYFDILCEIWDRAEPCPESALPLLLGDLDGWERVVDQLVVAGKLRRTPNGLTNDRAMKEAVTARDLWRKRSAGGKAGAEYTNRSRNGAASSGRSTPAGAPVATLAGSADAEPEPEPEKKGSIGHRQPVDSSSLGFSYGLMDRVAALTDACLNATGIAVTPAKLIVQRGIVAAWLETGIEPPSVIETLDAAMARQPVGQSVSSLRYFDRHIRQAFKRSEAQKNGHVRHRFGNSEPTFGELALAQLNRIRCQSAASGGEWTESRGRTALLSIGVPQVQRKP